VQNEAKPEFSKSYKHQQSIEKIEDYRKSYAKVLEKAKVRGVPLGGRVIAGTEWRIA